MILARIYECFLKLANPIALHRVVTKLALKPRPITCNEHTETMFLPGLIITFETRIVRPGLRPLT